MRRRRFFFAILKLFEERGGIEAYQYPVVLRPWFPAVLNQIEDEEEDEKVVAHHGVRHFHPKLGGKSRSHGGQTVEGVLEFDFRHVPLFERRK